MASLDKHWTTWVLFFTIFKTTKQRLQNSDESEFFSFPEIRAHNKVFLCILKQQTMITSTKQWEKKTLKFDKIFNFFFLFLFLFRLLFSFYYSSVLVIPKWWKKKEEKEKNYLILMRKSEKQEKNIFHQFLDYWTNHRILPRYRHHYQTIEITMTIHSSLSLFIYRWLLFDLILQWMANSFQH